MQSSPNSAGIVSAQPHVSACVCTFKRQAFLKHSLEALTTQETGGLFTFSIVVVDNDEAESARAVVSAAAAGSAVSRKYCGESRQNIALARNKAIENATGDFVAFLDDDEVPIKEWLLTLFLACIRYNVDGVLGPVKPRFDERVPAWVVK